MERKKVEMLFLSEPDMIEAGVLDVKHCVETMDETIRLLGEGDYVQGGYNGADHGCMLWYPKESPFPNMPLEGPDRRYMAMPAYLGGRFNTCGVKWYGSNISNPRERGLPRSILLVCLNDAVSGEPYAIMSANLLSAMRTGSIPGVATKYLAKEGAESLGVIGCGVISRACARGILISMPAAKKLILNDIRHESAVQFAEEFKAEFPDIEVIVEDSLEATVRASDVISVAAAGPVPVHIEREWLRPGCLFTATGHAELAEDVWKNETVVFDYWPMHDLWYHEGKAHKDGIISTRTWAPSYDMFKLLEKGEVKSEDMISLSDVAVGKVQPRKSQDELIIFVSGGLPIEDVAWGKEMYDSAVAKGLGQTLKLWDESHWL